MRLRRLKAVVIAVLVGGAALYGAPGRGGAAPSPIVMAELFPMSGREAFVGQWFLHGARAAVYDVNHNGGVMGRPLAEALGDTGGDPVDAVPAWRQLLLKHPAFEIGPSSLEIQGVIKLYDQAHLVDFMEGGTSQVDHMQYQYVWRTTPSDTTLTAAMAYYAIQKHLMRAVMFFETTSDATAELTNTTNFYKAHGGTVLDTEQLALHQPSYRSEVAKAFATHPDVVFVKTDPQTGSTLFSDIKELGHMNVPFVSDDGGATLEYAKAMGLDSASKYLIGVAGAPPQGPAWQHFLADYAAVWHSDKPLELSQNTYDGVVIAALAMTEAHTTDGTVWVNHIMRVSNPPGQKCYDYAGCVKLLRSGTKINFEGATGPDDFNQYHNVFGDWDMVQFDATGSTLHVLVHVPASVVAQYMAR
jgi:ABC-type branched-subunit amino acid transport system substrate-binding protein